MYVVQFLTWCNVQGVALLQLVDTEHADEKECDGYRKHVSWCPSVPLIIINLEPKHIDNYVNY